MDAPSSSPAAVAAATSAKKDPPIAVLVIGMLPPLLCIDRFSDDALGVRVRHGWLRQDHPDATHDSAFGAAQGATLRGECER